MLEFSSTESCSTDSTSSSPLSGFSSNSSSCDGNVALMNDFESTSGCSNQGAQGADGFSAYQIAVFNGFVGTEEEWLASLVGEPGPGVPPNGISGQILAKIDDTSYNTEWIDNADLTGYVPYTGATQDVDLGLFDITAAHLIKDGGQATQFLKADGSVDNNVYLTSADLPSTLDLYATTTASDIPGYTVLVRNISDIRFNTTAVDVSTGPITTTAQLVGSLVSDANIISGNPGIFNIITIGNISRTSGTGQAEFFFRVYKRDNLGVEIFITESSKTLPVTNGGYVEFSATALWNDGVFLDTDRVVLKYYANRLNSPVGSNPTYKFQFGGISPVRSTAAIPVAVLPNIYLRDLADVENVDALNNEVLYWNDADSLWEHSSVIGLLSPASSTVNGYLTSTDWTAFNGKFNLPSLTSGSVLFSNGTTIAQDNANFFWNNTSKKLGIGTSTFVGSIKLAVNGQIGGSIYSGTYLDVTGGIPELRGNSGIGYYSSAGNHTFYGGSSVEYMRLTTAGLLGIGTNSPSEILHISGTTSADRSIRIDRDISSTNGQFYLKGITIGGGPALLIGSGNSISGNFTGISYMGGSNNVGIGMSTTVVPTSPLTVGRNITQTVAGGYTYISAPSALTFTQNTLSNGNVVGFLGAEFYYAGNSAYGNARLLNMTAYVSNTSASNNMRAGYISARTSSGGSATTLTGYTGELVLSGTGAVINAIGQEISLIQDGIKTTTNLYGIKVQDLTNSAGTITNTYGIYLGNLTAGIQTNAAYGIYQSSATNKNYFAGSIGIGTISPASKLHIGAAPVASTNYGTLSIGGGAFNGSTAGYFIGSVLGTSLAINEVSGYGGNLLDLQVAGVTKLKVDTTGSIFYQTSSASGLKWDNLASIMFNGQDQGIVVTPYATNYVGFSVKGRTSQTYDLQQWQNSIGTVLAKVTASGNIGIGNGATANTSPLDIQVVGAGEKTIMSARLSNTNVNQLAGYWNFYTNVATAADFFGKFGYKFEGGVSDSFKQFQIYIADASIPKLVVSGAGNVGIGTIAPTGKLDVSGRSTAAPSATITAGDLVVDTLSKNVFIGRLSNISGDNTFFTFRDRIGGIKSYWENASSGSISFGNFGTNYGVYIGTTALSAGATTTGRFVVDSGSIGFPSAIFSSGNVGIGNSNPVAKLQVDSTTSGFLPPRMTTGQKNAIVSPATGLIVFDTDLGKLCVFAVTWQTITSA